MVKWQTEYQQEAADCDAIVLSSIVNPCFRVKFFDLHYPEQEESSQLLIENAFNSAVEEMNIHKPTPPPEDTDEPTEPDEFDVFGTSDSGPSKNLTSELEDYLSGKFPIGKGQTPLHWWKVRPSLLILIFLI